MRDGKHLILKRAETEVFLQGFDEIPSGGVEEGESLSDALIREVKEETCLDLTEINGYANHFDYTSASGRKARQFNFNVAVNAEQSIVLGHREHSSFCWSSPHHDDFQDLNLSEQTRTAVLQAYKLQMTLKSEGHL